MPALVSSPLAAGITNLDLVILDGVHTGPTSIIHDLLPLRTILTNLSLTLLGLAPLSDGDVAALHSFTSLKALRLEKISASPFAVGPHAAVFPRPFLGDELRRLLACWSRIYSLSLRCYHVSAYCTSRIVGETCRHLVRLRLYHTWLWIPLGKGWVHKSPVGPPLFPKLKTLELWTSGTEGRYVVCH